MLSRAFHSLIWFAAVMVAYWLYALLIVPWIEPGPRLLSSRLLGETSGQDAEAGLSQRLAALFPPDAWELAEPKVLETDQGMLLFRDYQPLEDQQTIQLNPVTLVFFTPAADDRGASGQPRGRRAIVMEAPGGAILHFDAPLDLTRAQIGKLVGGRLLGEVTIRSPRSHAAADDELQIITRNIQIEPERIWTPHDVSFRLGKNYGTGRDLSIRLQSAAQKTDQPALLSQVASLELVHVDRLHLFVPGQGLLGTDTEPPQPLPDVVRSIGPVEPAPATPVEVTCRGPFQFDFVQQVASFEDQVDVTRLNPDGMSDQLSCDLLEIYFASPSDQSTSEQVSAGGQAAADGGEQVDQPALAVQRVVAVGQPVILSAPSAHAAARGERLEYDFARQRLRLESTDKVMFRHKHHEIQTARLEYELEENPRLLGHFWAQGPGVLRSEAQDEEHQMLEASWAKEVLLRPHQQHKVISLYGQAHVGSEDGYLDAEEVHLYLVEVPRPEKPGSFRIEVNQLLAIGGVQVEAPQFSGETERLMVWFRNLSSPAQQNIAASEPPGRHLPVQRVVSRQPTPVEQFRLTGNEIYAQLIRRDGETTAESLTVKGAVSLRETAENSQRPLLTITGELLELSGTQTPQMEVHVQGAPAEIVHQSLRLIGPDIQFSGASNQLWVAGAGQMTLSGRRAPNRQPMAGQLTEMTVHWGEQMHFDGRTAHFRQQVRLNGRTFLEQGELRELNADGQHLDVTLNRPIELGGSSAADDLEVQHLLLHGRFYCESRQFGVDGIQQSLERMQAADLQMDQLTGKLSAAGPGWMRSVTLGRFAAEPGQLTGANDQASSSQMVYLNVNFRDGLDGNLHDHILRFLGHERTLYVPALAWDDIAMEPAAMQSRGRAVTLTSDQLIVVGSRANSVQLEALGNTFVESGQLVARGHRMTYDQGKGLLVVEGDGRNDVLFKNREQSQFLAVGKLQFWPATEERPEELSLEQVRSLDWKNLNSTGHQPAIPPSAVPAPGRWQ